LIMLRILIGYSSLLSKALMQPKKLCFGTPHSIIIVTQH
jgi:hypothetical protein